MSVLADLSGERVDPWCLTDDDSARLLVAGQWQRLVLVGDSLVEGVREPVPGYRDLGWGDRLAASLAATRPDFAYLNLGARGLLAAEVRLTQLAPAVAFEPDLAAVVCGGNDALRPGFVADEVEADLDETVRALVDVGATVVMFGLLDITRSGLVPEPYVAVTRGVVERLSDITRSVAERRGALFVDLTSHPVAADDGIYCGDLIHLNARGHAVFAAETVRALASEIVLADG